MRLLPSTSHPSDLDRNTFIYLPDNWQTSGRRYPVIYMFDGHNLFFDSTATFGTCLGLKDYLDAHPNAIVVAPECNHEGNKRLEEYCCWATGLKFSRQPPLRRPGISPSPTFRAGM